MIITIQTNRERICNCSLFAQICKNLLNHENISINVNVQNGASKLAAKTRRGYQYLSIL